MYDEYKPTKWSEGDGSEYGADCFNNIEYGIKNLEIYAKYREKQAINMGKALKKLRLNQDIKIALRGDSVFFGYNTVTGGEEGNRRYKNDIKEDKNLSEYAKELGFEGFFFYGEHPLRKLASASGSIKASSEVTGNGTVNKTEVQIPEVMIQCLNEVFENHITFINKIYTGDCAISSFLRYTEDNAADIELCNIGINDALAAFLGAEYVGNVPEFMYWYTRLIERALDAGSAFIIVTPVLQTTVASYDIDARTTVDVYEKILYDIGKLYGIPVINGNELSHNFNNKLIIDFTHFTCGGNETIGKRMAAPLLAGDLVNYYPVTNGSMVGVRPQEDSINVYGNACIEYTSKAPSYASLLDNNDLYDTGVNRIDKGLGVFMNYSLDGTVKDLYDESILQSMDLSALNIILTNVWSMSEVSDTSTAITTILEAQNDYILNQAHLDNIFWRQADLFARSSGVRGSDAYKIAFNNRISFLQTRHGYADNKTGKVTWAFYCDKDGMVVIPSIYGESGTVIAELDFESIVPEKNGYFLTFKTLDELQTIASDLELSVSDSDTKETLIAKIKVAKGYDKPGFSQSAPSDICDWLNTDEINYDYIEPAHCEITLNGYYNKRKITSKTDPVIKITSKGWHTITLYSKDNDRFLAFGLQFIDFNRYSELIQNSILETA